ncbi:MAG: MATE family efflux transporter [Methylotenera sp.]|nr:MATE family efflux transporter [Oligoflexia bacterium]
MKNMLKLATPVVLTYLGLMLMGFVDLLFVGRVSPTAIGAVGVGTSIFIWFMIFGIGLLTGMDYPISHAFGAGKTEEGHRVLNQGLIVSVIMSVPLTVMLLFLNHHLAVFGFNPQILSETQGYLEVIAWSLLPTFVFSALRQYLQAIGIARPALVILVVANVLNALANYALIFGKWGMPALGTVGSAWATFVSRGFMMIVMAIYVWRWDAKHHQYFKKVVFQYERDLMKTLLRLGTPSALQMLFEVGVFATSTTLAAKLTASELAAHQIVLNTASMTFMVPMGISSATAVLVGQHMGKNDFRGARITGWRGFALGVGFMAFSAVMLLLFPDAILSIYTTDSQVLEVGKSLLLVVALFQLSDGAQVVGTGALRGIADTHSPMYVNLVGHWALGLPVGVYLCFSLHWGVKGLWVGLSSGLTLVALTLVFIWWKKSHLLKSRTVVEIADFA